MTPTVTTVPTSSSPPTPKPLRVGDNSVMVPISALIPSKEDAPKGLSSTMDADDDVISDASGDRYSGWIVCALISGLASLLLLYSTI